MHHQAREFRVVSILRRSWWSLMWMAFGTTMLVISAKQGFADGLSGSSILAFTMGLSISGAAASRFVSENYAPRIARALNRILLPLALVLVIGLFSLPFLGFFR